MRCSDEGTSISLLYQDGRDSSVSGMMFARVPLTESRESVEALGPGAWFGADAGSRDGAEAFFAWRSPGAGRVSEVLGRRENSDLLRGLAVVVVSISCEA